jgi:hypothetical protein
MALRQPGRGAKAPRFFSEVSLFLGLAVGWWYNFLRGASLLQGGKR